MVERLETGPTPVAPTAAGLAPVDAPVDAYVDGARPGLVGSVFRGAVAGAVGVAAMTTAEKIEQRFTHRPNSFVPAHTLERLLRLPVRPNRERRVLNHVMHWGTGIALGALRGGMAHGGARGVRASFVHSGIRLTTDQTLENATGVGSPPWTWPRAELVIDVAHKVIYGLTTGAVTDILVTGRHSARRP